MYIMWKYIKKKYEIMLLKVINFLKVWESVRPVVNILIDPEEKSEGTELE